LTSLLIYAIIKVMRTTLTLEDDAIEAVQEFSVRRGISLGKAASELIRRGSRYQLGVRKVNGLPVLDASGDIPAITAERVRELLDEE
jgi:hypothetical protein